MKRDYRLYIKDILECTEGIEEFVGDMNFNEFVEDDKTSSAVARKLEIIGEATKNIRNLLLKDMNKFHGKIWQE